MAAKILCAGFSKDERAAVEAEVKPVLGGRPAEESWTVSLVKAGARLAVSVDGPDERIRGKNFAVELSELRQKLFELLINNGFPPGEAPPAPAPEARPAATANKHASAHGHGYGHVKPAAPARPQAPSPAPKAPSVVATPPRPMPIAKPAAAPPKVAPAARSVPAAPPKAPSRGSPSPSAPADEDEAYDWESPHTATEHRQTHRCPKCQGRYAVVYESLPNEARQTVSVACPHCWERDQVEIGESPAIARLYRADKLKD